MHVTQKDVLEKVLQNGKSGKVSGIDLEKKKKPLGFLSDVFDLDLYFMVH